MADKKKLKMGQFAYDLKTNKAVFKIGTETYDVFPIDTELSETSNNPVSNAVITGKIKEIEEGGGSGYVLPPATAKKLGGIKVGEGLTIASDGTLSAHGGGGGEGGDSSLYLLEHEYFNCNNTGYITNIPLNSNYTIEVQFDGGPYKSNASIFGNANGSGEYAHLTEFDGKWYVGGNGESHFGRYSGGIHTFVYNGENNNCYMDGVLGLSNIKQVTTDKICYTIACRGNTASNTYNGKIYYMQFTDKSSNTIIHLFKPCSIAIKVKDKYIRIQSGLFDAITDEIYNVANWTFGDIVNVTPIGGGSGGDLQPATTETLGGIIVGNNLEITKEGILSAVAAPYELPKASAETLGGVKIGQGVSIDANGVISVTGGGSVTVDTELDKTSNNPIANKSVAEKFEVVDRAIEELTPYTLPIASAETLGGVKIGDNITISEDGKISAPAPTPEYNLPVASAEVLGGIKIGEGLNITEEGILSTNGGGGGGGNFKEVTKAYYDNLSDEEKKNGTVYFIKDWSPNIGGGGGGSSYPIISKSEFDTLTIEEIQQKGIFGIRTDYEIQFIDGAYYYESYPLIPVLTSNTGENGTASCPLSSPLYNGENNSTTSYAYYAFDASDSTHLEYYGEHQSGAWCRYDFNEPIHLKSMTAKIGHYNVSNVFNYFLQYLKDGTEDEWINVGEGIHTGDASVVEHKLDDAVVTSAVRFYSTTNKTPNTNIFLYSMQAYGYV